MGYGSYNKNKLRDKISSLYKFITIAVAALLILNYLIQNSSVYYRKMYYSPFQVHLNNTDVVLIKGEEYKLRVFGINERVKYSSTDFRVAGVNFNGRIYGYQTGNCFIIAKAGKKELKCRVTVLDINKERLSLSVGESYRLRIKGGGGFPDYKSSNPEIATVSWLGKVKAKAQGKSVITVKAEGKTFRCTIIVK